jgi:hypothetical protein
MEIIKFTQCASSLNFEPLQTLKPGLTPTAYEGELLNGFQSEDLAVALNYNIEDCKLFTLLKSLYDDLSYVEVLRLHTCLEKTPHLTEQTTEEFFSTFGLKLDENLKQTNLLVIKLPSCFLNWCVLKKMGPQDFAPLKSFSEGIPKLRPFLEKFNHSVSKSDGAQIFELLIELLMMDQNMDYLLQLELPQWLPKLKKMRYPLTSEHAQIKEALVQKMNWPLHSQAKWVRKGDKSGVELKLFFSHPQDLKRSLIKLEQIEMKDLWSID